MIEHNPNHLVSASFVEQGRDRLVIEPQDCDHHGEVLQVDGGVDSREVHGSLHT